MIVQIELKIKEGKHEMKIGAQLFSVNTKCKTEAGIRETFRVMKQQGYESVQISGFEYDSARVKDYANEFGLHIGLTHTPISRIIEETDAVIKDHLIMGASVVGIGYPNGYVKDGIVDVDNMIAELMPAILKIQDAGLGFAYHNHAMEFVDQGGYNTMDQLFEKTNWNFTLDTGWCVVAGGDVLKAIEKYATRLKYVHLKDFRAEKPGDIKIDERIVSLYHGMVPMDEILNALKKIGTVEVAYVEQDTASLSNDPYAEMGESIKQLKRRGWI